MKKLLAVFTLLVCSLSFSVFAADVKAGSVKAPGKGKVVIVGRPSFKTPVNYDEYATILGISEKQKSKGIKYSVGNYEDGFIAMYDMEEPFYYTAKVEKDGTVTLPYFQVCLYQNTYMFFRLPLQVKIRIPEGSSYVYVGNFEYDLDYALQVKGFKHYDEFDKAEEWINRATGKECDLWRGELEFLD